MKKILFLVKGSGMGLYIHQLRGWPKFAYDDSEILPLLSHARNLQGRLMGKMEAIGFDLQSAAVLNTLTLDVLKTSEIEGEYLDQHLVRSSIAQKLGVDIGGSLKLDRNIDGVVEMMLDATQNYQEPLTHERLFMWHKWLFPSRPSGLHRMTVGAYRTGSNGPMQVVSGAIGRETVHFEAPDAALISREMEVFLEWFNSDETPDQVLKAAMAHLWFVTIHPFSDGNGRIGRALTDMLLARSDSSSQRFYSLSASIRIDRKNYYEILEKTQRGSLDITEWMVWFLLCLLNSLKLTEINLSLVFAKVNFWKKHAETILSERQKLIINKVLDGFEGKLTSEKYAKIGKCSKDSAVRDLNDLIAKNVFTKSDSGGRSTSYLLV
ncbi:Fic family protein [Flavobacterium sp.]|uniref:Fic family protein n=1 Tax=Flavobacterium sp. TaxID=239 RepID=UPI002633F8A0|nr:Fic family protein [Flavobacterium sp.]